MPLGVVFGLGSATGWGVSNFLAGVQARKLTALSVVVTSEFVTTPLLFLVLFALGESPPLDGLAWGALAEMILLDGRQFRSDQSCGDIVLSLDPACPETADPPTHSPIRALRSCSDCC